MSLLEMPELCEWTQHRLCPAGQTLFLEGDPSQTVYQVVQGIVKLTRVSSSGREVIVGLACPGDFIDVVAILDGETHGVGASALVGTDVELLCVPRERALACAELYARLEATCLHELRNQRDWTVAMALERVETRALTALGTLARRLSGTGEASRPMKFVLTRQEFAEMIGTTTETAIRILSQFRRHGLIREEGGWMTLSPDACVPA